jgi:putative peptidoglycan lipid II flippase
MAPRVGGLAVVQVNFLVNTIIASSLGEGSLSALNFAWLLMLLPQGIVAQGIATAAFPTFSALAAQNRRAEMRLTFSGTLRAILFLSIPATVGLFVLRVPLIRMLLERGQFGEGSTAAVATALAFYAWGLVGHSVVEIAARAFYSLHDTLTPVLAGVGAMVLNVALSLMLRGSMGIGGLALANTLATSLEMMLLLVLLSRRLGGLDGSRVWQSARRSLVVSAVMAPVLAGPVLLWPEANPWLLGPLLLATGTALYLVWMWAAKSDELDGLLYLLRSRVRKTG